MDIVLYILIFIIGTIFGSFFTLATYRIPRKQDITHTRSFCPNCEHKLGFLDMIPVLSYVFLRGKCRYCKQKISPRYLILEILSGITFLSIAYLSGLTIENLSITTLVTSAFMTLYLCYIFIIGGIDRENRQIQRGVNVFGILISMAYMIYLCTIEQASIYRYVIYLGVYIIVLTLDNITLKRYAKNSYINGLIIQCIIMTIFTSEYIILNTIICTAIAVAVYLLLYKIKNLKNRSKKTDKQVWKTICVGYFLALFNIINLIAVLAYYKFFII